MKELLTLLVIFFYTGSIKSFNGTLPVELVYFDAVVQSNSVLLLFGTATEQNNFGFDIERADISRNWEKIGFVSKEPFNSNVPKDYQFEDTAITANGVYYYRLKQLDIGGGFEYSMEDTVEVDFITGVNPSMEVKPDNYVIFQNYPNPFNPVTNFEFRIPAGQSAMMQFVLVKLKIYDLLGNEVSTLINEEKSAGEYKVTFDASTLASGVYLYRFSAGKYISAGQMLLIK